MSSPRDVAGRSCPLRYRYGPAAIAQAPEKAVETLYVVGGLYGNRPALDALDALVAAESGPVTVCFNGDFNWFNVDDDGFAAINRRVLEHDAILGNVEAELGADGAADGCGCAYPAGVDDAVVDRSNAIHARLKATAARHPAILEALSRRPMVARYRVGDTRVGVVHGDAESLAGWRFDVAALDAVANVAWIEAAFAAADVDVFACTHTCLPALRRFPGDGDGRVVINNGAAGMPNFAGRCSGLITRIGRDAAPGGSLYGRRRGDVVIEAVELPYVQADWLAMFLRLWPPGSPAHRSYHARLTLGPDHDLARAASSAVA